MDRSYDSLRARPSRTGGISEFLLIDQRGLEETERRPASVDLRGHLISRREIRHLAPEEPEEQITAGRRPWLVRPLLGFAWQAQAQKLEWKA